MLSGSQEDAWLPPTMLLSGPAADGCQVICCTVECTTDMHACPAGLELPMCSQS